MLFANYLDGTVSISELLWNLLHFIHKNRIIMGGGALFFPSHLNFTKSFFSALIMLTRKETNFAKNIKNTFLTRE